MFRKNQEGKKDNITFWESRKTKFTDIGNILPPNEANMLKKAENHIFNQLKEADVLNKLNRFKR